MALPETRLELYLAAMSDPDVPCPHFPEATLSRLEIMLEACVHEYKRVIDELNKRTEYVEIYFKDGYLKDKDDRF